MPSRRFWVWAGAIALLTCALALAAGFAASSARDAKTHGAVLAKGDPDSSADAVGPNESVNPDNTEAAAAYAERAYPATDIPLQATLNAQAAFTNVKSRGLAKGRPAPPAGWELIGPSQANYPAVLTFSGAPYTASGRITALAVSPNCRSTAECRVWVAAAGGGIWRTDDGLTANPTWTFMSSSFATNAIGTLTYAGGDTLYAGTGEPNASGDSEAGLGLYRSDDNGKHWTKLASQVTALATAGNGTYTGDAFAGRSISSVVVDPANSSVLYVSSTRGVRGVSSVTGGATTNPPTPRPPFGLFKSTDGGATFSFIWDGNASIRGVNHVELDPSDSSIVYAAAFQQGVWRSNNGGSTFTQIKAPLDAANNTDRAEFAVTQLPNGKTRMYVGDGNSVDSGADRARFYRSDDVATGTPVFTDLTTSQNIGYCTGQCWYDNFVVSPKGYPDMVYLGGSFSYGSYGFSTNGRGVLLSTDAGASFTDETWDATTNPTPSDTCCQPNAVAPNGIHPDQHALVVAPNNPGLFFEGSDGGLMRSSGDFADISSQCDSRPLGPISKALCKQLLSRVPTQLSSLNDGLSTLQFQSLSINPAAPSSGLMGGTQDNGTFEYSGSSTTWPQIIYGDGGQSGWNVSNSAMRFNSYFGQNHNANFQNGNPTKWVVIGGPIASSPEGSNFYVPVIPDPNAADAGSIFEGSQSVWRTQDWGGSQAYLEANCPEFFVSDADPSCGDFVRIGPVGATDLTAAGYGTRAGGFVAALARTPSDTGTLWAATTTGRVFISKNANDASPSAVTWTRLDTLPSATADPGRFVSGITVDPNNANHAWISYSGYNFNTPSQPGHVFEVAYNGTSDATWTDVSNDLGDLPATGIARDDATGDLYASSDFGVERLASGTTTWTLAAPGMPNVEVAGLSINSGARVLYAATHGRGAWKLNLG